MYKYLLVIFFLSSSVFAQTIQWGFQNLLLNGQKDEVLKLTDQLQKVYNTDLGEKLINSLGIMRVRYLVEQQDQWRFDPDRPNLLMIGEQKDFYQEELFNLLSEIFRFHYGEDERLNLSDFLGQIEKETTIKIQHPKYDYITIQGAEKKIAKLLSVLEEIDTHTLGHKLFDDMSKCGNTLLIYDDKSSLSGGGYAGPVQTSRRIFTPGLGESSFIRFRFDQPLSGSHIVQARPGEIPFTYIDNLFHELVHAKHLMCGTFSPRAAETQAIIEENEFRSSRPETAHWPPRDFSKYEDGRQVWFGKFLREKN